MVIFGSFKIWMQLHKMFYHIVTWLSLSDGPRDWLTDGIWITSDDDSTSSMFAPVHIQHSLFQL